MSLTMQAPPAQHELAQAQVPAGPTQSQTPLSHSPQQLDVPSEQAVPFEPQQAVPPSVASNSAPPENSITVEAQVKPSQHWSWLEHMPSRFPQVPQVVPLTQLALLQSASVRHGPPGPL
jgi:hypothetical protein